MKLTRRQLKTIILESILNEMPMIKPKDPMNFIKDPEHKRKLDMLKDDDKTQAYNIAATIQPDLEDILSPGEIEEMESELPAGAQLEEPGYRGDDYFQDLKRYESISLMGVLGDSVYYLADKDIDILTNIIGKDLYYTLYSNGGGFWNINTRETSVYPENLHEMAIRIAAKKRDIDESDYEQHDDQDSSIDAHHKLSIAIIELSRKTSVEGYNMENLGIGEFVKISAGVVDPQYAWEFFKPEYEKLWRQNKLDIL